MLRRLLSVLVVAASVMLLGAPLARANPDAADLSVKISWVGRGTPRVHSGDTATWRVTVSNLGPDQAQQVSVFFGGTDQWNTFTGPCGTSRCDLGLLAPGASVTITFSARACGLVTGESRQARVSASVESPTPDPNTDNNATGDFITKITGPHGEPCSPSP